MIFKTKLSKFPAATLTSLAILVSACLGNAAPNIKTDPYNNDGQVIRTGLNVTDGAILPNIVYPFVPSGNALQNWGAKDVRSASDIAALEAVIIFMAQTFSAKTSVHAKTKSTGQMLWSLSVYFSVFGLMLSSFFLFRAVAQGKKGPGEAIVSLVLKFTVVLMMFIMICPNLPPILIGLSNYVTQGIDGWFSYTTASGKPSNKGSDLLLQTYQTKMTAGCAAGAVMLADILDAVNEMAANDPTMVKAAIEISAAAAADPDIMDATNKDNQYITNGLADVMAAFTMGKSVYDINRVISEAAKLPPSIVAKQMQKIIRNVLNKNAPNSPPEPIIEAIVKAPQGSDLSSFVYPDRLIGTYAYIAFTYLSLSIWGMGFASLTWVIIYSMPEEWNMSGILYTGFKGALTILLSIILVTIYMGAGLNWSNVKTKKISTDIPTLVEGKIAQVKSIGSTVGGAISAAGNGLWRIGKMFATLGTGGGVGEVIPQLVSSFTGMTLEQFMIGLLIVTAPAQAGMMVKGANGVGESAAKALSAQGASGQGLAGMLGMQGGGSGATLGANTSAQSIMSSRSGNPSGGSSGGGRGWMNSNIP